MNKFLSLICLMGGLTGNLFPQQTQNVFIIVIDGARYTETFGDPTHQYIPKMWSQLKPQGALYKNFYDDGATATNPGHASILTGTWQYIANDGTERPHRPTVFEYYRKEKSTSLTDNYVILGKSKLNILAYSDYTGYGSTYRASIKNSTSEYNDAVTFANIKSVCNTYHPKLLISNFAQVDDAGHSGV